jgi:hypothetical protein
VCESGEAEIASFLVYLHRAYEGRTCVAEFRGVLIEATLVTMDAVCDLIDQEKSVVLDFTRVRAIDGSGANAMAALARSIRSRGSHLVMKAPIPRSKGAYNAYSGPLLQSVVLSDRWVSHD